MEVRKTKEQIIAEIKAHMLRVGQRVNQSKKNRNNLRNKARTAYQRGNKAAVRSLLMRSKLREQAIDRALQAQRVYKTVLTKIGGDPSTLNPVYGLATGPVVEPVDTRNPLHVAEETKRLREYYTTQIATTEAKLDEVKKAIEALPADAIPQLRIALDETVQIYEKQIANLKAKRPVGGSKRQQTRHKKRHYM